MLKDVHSDCTVKVIVRKRHPVLTGAGCDAYDGEPPFDFRRHIFPQLDTMVILAGQILELQMAASSGANLNGTKVRSVRQIFQRVAVIEFLN